MMAFVEEGARALETTDPLVLDDVFRLRVRAWRAREPDFPEMDRWTDAFDGVARHWVVVRNGEVAGAARMTVHDTLSQVPDARLYSGVIAADTPGPIATFTRLVVAPSHAATGISRALDLARLQAASEAQCRLAILVTYADQKRAVELEGLGFRVAGAGGEYETGPLIGLGSGGPRASVVLVRNL